MHLSELHSWKVVNHAVRLLQLLVPLILLSHPTIFTIDSQHGYNHFLADAQSMCSRSSTWCTVLLMPVECTVFLAWNEVVQAYGEYKKHAWCQSIWMHAWCKYVLNIHDTHTCSSQRPLPANLVLKQDLNPAHCQIPHLGNLLSKVYCYCIGICVVFVLSVPSYGA